MVAYDPVVFIGPEPHLIPSVAGLKIKSDPQIANPMVGK